MAPGRSDYIYFLCRIQNMPSIGGGCMVVAQIPNKASNLPQNVRSHKSKLTQSISRQ